MSTADSKRGVPFMVMRKEMSHIIAPFDLRRINFLGKPIPPDQNDKKFINNLNKLDSFIMRRAEYRRVRGSVHSGHGGLYRDIREMASR